MGYSKNIQSDVICRVIQGSASSQPTPRLPISLRSVQRKSRRKGTSFRFEALPDSGCTKTIIGFDLAVEFGLDIDRSGRKYRIRAANSNSMQCEGTVLIEFSYEGTSVIVKALVSKDIEGDILVSWHDLQLLKVLPPNFPARIDAIDSVALSESVSVYTSSSENFELSDDQQQQLKKVTDKYSDVFGAFGSTKLRPMKGPPMQIHLKKGIPIRPKRVLTARAIPLGMHEEAEQILKQALEDGILRRVEGPTEWVSPAFFVRDPAKSPGVPGKVRLVTDYQALNQHVDRPIHPFYPTGDVLKQIHPDSRFFATLDAVKGYFQVDIAKESQLLTTMLLPQGRFCYTRAPMGLSSSSDEWNYRSDMAVRGCEGLVKLVDDMLIQAPTFELLMKRLSKVLRQCLNHQLTISLPKLRIGTSVKFAGHIISHRGIEPDPMKLSAIKSFPPPKDSQTDLKSFLGLVNQLGHFTPDLAMIVAPLRELLKKDIKYLWLPEHEQAFNKAREILSGPALVKPFKKGLKTVLYTDAARTRGIGYCLIQFDTDDSPRLVHCGSRRLSSAESNYSTIELEALGVTWGIIRCKHYLYGGNLEFDVITDHRPLMGIFKKDLMDIENSRLRRFREKLTDYRFQVNWIEGKNNLIADALSRSPVSFIEDNYDEFDSNHVKICSLEAANHPPLSLAKLKEFAENDPSYQAIIKVLIENKNIDNLPPLHPARTLKSIWPEFSFEPKLGLLLMNDRIFVPMQARQTLVEELHRGHCGVSKSLTLARQLYYWPSYCKQIKNRILACDQCQELLASQQKQPMFQSDQPKGPMQQINCDLFHHQGKDFLIAVDGYSGYPFVFKLKPPTSARVIELLESKFQEYGFPSQVRCDSGPQFLGEFIEFCQSHDIDYDPSSAYYPRSNGKAEAGVKNAKYLLKKCNGNFHEFESQLADWKNIPRSDGFSPSELFFGRRLKARLPLLPQKLLPIDQKDAARARESIRAQSKHHYDAHSKDLAPLPIGTQVRLQDPATGEWTGRGKITDIRPDGRSYYIRKKGVNNMKRVTLRNRIQLRPFSGNEEDSATERSSRPSARPRSPQVEEKVLPRRSERLAKKKNRSYRE